MITLNFDEVLERTYNAKKGVDVRYGLGQGFEYCKQFAEEAGKKADAARDEAKGYAADAKASEEKAAKTVAGIEQTKADAVTAVQQAQTTATDAVAAKQTEAVQAVGTAQTDAVKAVDDERDAALQQVADSTAMAKSYAESAASAAGAAGTAANAATTSAQSAESSATAASGSASAAATSESNAASSAQSSKTDADRAEASAELAGTRANTDKTLKTENAPADAKAVGDIILDEDGNVLFYSKTAVDELLAGKLDLTGGTMSGDIAIAPFISGEYPFYANKTVEGNILVRLNNEHSGVGAGFGIGGLGNEIGAYDFLNNLWIIMRNAKNGQFYLDGQLCLGFVVASGSNYVRFGDGTQICWGRDTPASSITSTEKYISFPLPFGEDAKVFTTNNANMGGVPVQVGWETSVGFTFGGGWNGNASAGGETNWLAVGRWK